MIRLGVKRQHRARRPTSTSPAHAAVTAAVDRLLDPLENLRQEGFRSEPIEATQTGATEGVARPRLPINLGRPFGWLRVLPARMLYSNRPPYRQLRKAVFPCLIGLIAIAWLLVARMP
jgi:hypothetical protein